MHRTAFPWLRHGSRQARMKVAILETGRPPASLAPRFGDYVDMFRTLVGPGFEMSSYDVENGVLPARASDHDAYLITGSPAGVYEERPWIAPLIHFLRSA